MAQDYFKQRVCSPQIALILAALFWGGNFIVGRSLKEAVDPVTLNFWRWVTALIVLLPMGLEQIQAHRTLLISRWRLISGLGMTGVAAFHICAYQALKTTTAIKALIILSAFPVLILIMVRMLFGERVSRRQGLGILVSLAGALLSIVILGEGLALFHLAGALLVGTGILLTRKPG